MTNIASQVLGIIENYGKNKKIVDKNMIYLHSRFIHYRGEPLMIHYALDHSYHWIIGKINTLRKELRLNDAYQAYLDGVYNIKSLEFPVKKAIYGSNDCIEEGISIFWQNKTDHLSLYNLRDPNYYKKGDLRIHVGSSSVERELFEYACYEYFVREYIKMISKLDIEPSKTLKKLVAKEAHFRNKAGLSDLSISTWMDIAHSIGLDKEDFTFTSLHGKRIKTCKYFNKDKK